MRECVILGTDGHPRVTAFQTALAARGWPAARVVDYRDAGRPGLLRQLDPGCWIRFESPGQDFDVERWLIARGADNGEPERLEFDKGRLRCQRAWAAGWQRTLHELQVELDASRHARSSHSPADIGLMFDKPRCQARFRAAGLPTPELLGTIASWDDLQARMQTAGRRRVFVKLTHGSSASGVVAYQTDGRRQLALTTVEVVRTAGELRLYNSRRLQRLEQPADIATLINALAAEGAYAEEWVPKAAVGDGVCDLRVVTIGGEPRFKILRTSAGPFTNLHLLNRRSDAGPLQTRLGRDRWERLLDDCRRAAGLFPRSLWMGFDVAVSSDLRRHVFLEVNAFGDFVKGIDDGGESVHEAEIRLWERLDEVGWSPPNWDSGCGTLVDGQDGTVVRQA